MLLSISVQKQDTCTTDHSENLPELSWNRSLICRELDSKCRTKKLGLFLKLLSLLLLPIPLLLWPLVVAVGSVLVGLGYGFGTPLVATFEAVGENRDAKFYHAFMVMLEHQVLNKAHSGLIWLQQKMIFFFCNFLSKTLLQCAQGIQFIFLAFISFVYVKCISFCSAMNLTCIYTPFLTSYGSH